MSSIFPPRMRQNFVRPSPSGPSLRVVLAGAIRADVVPPLSEGPQPMTFAAGHASRVWRCPIAGASPMRFGRPTRRLIERSFTPIRAERVRVEDDVPRDGDVVAVFGCSSEGFCQEISEDMWSGVNHNLTQRRTTGIAAPFSPLSRPLSRLMSIEILSCGGSCPIARRLHV